MKSAFRILSTDCNAVRSISRGHECNNTRNAGWIYSRYEFAARFISTVWSRYILYSNRITNSDFRPSALRCAAKLTRETRSQRCILHCEEWERYQNRIINDAWLFSPVTSLRFGVLPISVATALLSCEPFLAIFRPCDRNICHRRGELHCCAFREPGAINGLKTVSLIFIKLRKRLNINMECTVL